MKKADVIVIGAGIGGITAATHLARSGLQVTVLEKNARAGGRWQAAARPTALARDLLPSDARRSGQAAVFRGHSPGRNCRSHGHLETHCEPALGILKGLAQSRDHRGEAYSLSPHRACLPRRSAIMREPA